MELDVHATRDGVVVVHHDPVMRGEDVPPSSAGRIDATSAAVLKRVELAPGVRVPTLAEALDAIGNRALVFVEIKAREIEPLVVRCIRESDSECAVHSFDHRTVRAVKKIFPAIRCGVLEVARHIDPLLALGSTGAEDLWQHVDFIDAELVAGVHSIGARVIAWTANEPSQWEMLRQLGVDGICTDRISALSAEYR